MEDMMSIHTFVIYYFCIIYFKTKYYTNIIIGNL
jgi:hypothetical protein